MENDKILTEEVNEAIETETVEDEGGAGVGTLAILALAGVGVVCLGKKAYGLGKKGVDKIKGKIADKSKSKAVEDDIAEDTDFEEVDIEN